MIFLVKLFWKRVIAGIAWLLLACWAVFWAWFIVGDALGHGKDSYGFAALLLAVVLVPTLLCFWRVRVGAVLLVLVGLGSLGLFDGSQPLWMVSVPPLVAGVLLFLTGGGSWARGR
jgi:hypothetical protein